MDFHPMLPKAYTMFIYPSLCNHTFLHFHQPVLPSQPYQLHQHQLPHISTHSSSMATSHTSSPCELAMSKVALNNLIPQEEP